MKFGSFLLGGLVGAAAVVYLNNRSKSMLFSAFNSNNQSIGNMMDKAKDKFTADANTATATVGAFDAKSSNKSTAFKKNDAFSAGGLSQADDVIKKDPSLQKTIQEILANSNQEKEALRTQ